MLRLAIISAFAAPLAVAYADHPRPPHPPQEAIDACANSKRGDSCTVTLHDHTMTGVCDAPPDIANAPLACRPDGPPPEAVEACASSKEGDACTVTLGEHSISGVCAKGPDASKPLACRPDHPPR